MDKLENYRSILPYSVVVDNTSWITLNSSWIILENTEKFSKSWSNILRKLINFLGKFINFLVEHHTAALFSSFLQLILNISITLFSSIFLQLFFLTTTTSIFLTTTRSIFYYSQFLLTLFPFLIFFSLSEWRMTYPLFFRKWWF